MTRLWCQDCTMETNLAPKGCHFFHRKQQPANRSTESGSDTTGHAASDEIPATLDIPKALKYWQIHTESGGPTLAQPSANHTTHVDHRAFRPYWIPESSPQNRVQIHYARCSQSSKSKQSRAVGAVGGWHWEQGGVSRQETIKGPTQSLRNKSPRRT